LFGLRSQGCGKAIALEALSHNQVADAILSRHHGARDRPDLHQASHEDEGGGYGQFAS
jgi:hypothetical protein